MTTSFTYFDHINSCKIEFRNTIYEYIMYVYNSCNMYVLSIFSSNLHYFLFLNSLICTLRT